MAGAADEEAPAKTHRAPGGQLTMSCIMHTAWKTLLWQDRPLAPLWRQLWAAASASGCGSWAAPAEPRPARPPPLQLPHPPMDAWILSSVSSHWAYTRERPCSGSMRNVADAHHTHCTRQAGTNDRQQRPVSAWERLRGDHMEQGHMEQEATCATQQQDVSTERQGWPVRRHGLHV